MTKDLKRMINLIETFNTQRSARTRRRIQSIRDFIAIYQELRETLSSKGIAPFNVFNILDIGNDEVRHSSFLAWLLDAKANHYQSNLFFNAFLQSCKIDLPLDRLTGYVVRPEFTGVESIIDILVYCKNEFIVFIENKIDSEEGTEQLAREFRDMRRLGSRLRIPHERQFAVFLTPDGREPVTGDPTCWQTLSYQLLGTLFGQLVPQITSDKVRFTLEDWLEVISSFGRE